MIHFTKENKDKLLDILVNKSSIEMNPDGTQGCWLWEGPRNKIGYGIYKYEHERLVHRISCSIFHPRKVYDFEGRGIRWVGRHLCHKPACWNPNHVVPGTEAENTADRIANASNRRKKPFRRILVLEIESEMLEALDNNRHIFFKLENPIDFTKICLTSTLASDRREDLLEKGAVIKTISKKRDTCPRCDHELKDGFVVCDGCGFDPELEEEKKHEG